jgi:hypothetical protein
MSNQNVVDEVKSVWFITSGLEGSQASSFRQERWCRIFLDCGMHLRIFNLRGAFGYSDTNITSHDELTHFRKQALDRQIGEKNSIREGFLAKVFRRIKHLLLIDLYLPNVILIFLRMHNAIKRQNEAISIMASSPPFSTAIIGAVLKLIHPKKVILTIDMRDAWAQHKSLRGFKCIKENIENIVLSKADFLGTVSASLSREFIREYGLKVEVIYNVATQHNKMVQSETFEWQKISPLIDSRKKIILYTGSLPEEFYDTDSVVDAIKIVEETDSDLKDRFQFIFIGACNEIKKKSIEKGIKSKNLIFVKHISHELVYEAQSYASALLFFGYLGDENGGVVSTKLFEYIQKNKPILPLNIYKNSDVDCILKKYCGSSIYIENSKDIIECLRLGIKNNLENLPSGDKDNKIDELIKDYKFFARKVIKKSRKFF